MTLKVLVAGKSETYLKLINGDSTYIPISLDELELYSSLHRSYVEVQTGDLRIPAWGNPSVTYGKMTRTQMLVASYLCLMTFMQIRETRDLWVSLPNVPNTQLSYMKERAQSDDFLLPYKVAMLRCLYARYKYHDIDRIKDEFSAVGLHPSNYVYYLLFILSKDYRLLKIDNSQPFILDYQSLLNESADFSSRKDTQKLCYFRTHKQLSFIVGSHNLDPHDLATELLMNTLVAYRIARPMNSIAYSENYARRAMTNVANRIIYAHTHYLSLKNIEQDSDGTFVRRFRSMTDVEETPSAEVLDIDAFRNSVLFNEDVMLEKLDRRYG